MERSDAIGDCPADPKGATSSKFDTSLAARSLLLIVRQERECVERAG
jgi:hypothetical protein